MMIGKCFIATPTVVENTREYLENKNTEKYTASANTGEYGRDYAEILLPHSGINNQPIRNGTEFGSIKTLAE